MNLKRNIQQWFAKWLLEPIIPHGKTCGYSVVKSELSNTEVSRKARVYAPFFLHKVELGDYSYVAKNCNITNCTIGKFCSIGPNFCCGLGIHPTNGISTSPMFYSTSKVNGASLVKQTAVEESKHTTIGNDVFIGANVTILDGITIGDGAVIGAGAVVTKDIPPYAIAVGVPTKVIKYRFDEQTIQKLQEKEWWNGSEEEIKKVGELQFRVGEYVQLYKDKIIR